MIKQIKQEMNQSYDNLQKEKKKSSPKMDEISIESSKLDEQKSKVLTLKKAAKLLNLSNYTVYRKARWGVLPHRKIGKHYYLSEGELVPYIKSGKVKTVDELETGVDDFLSSHKRSMDGKVPSVEIQKINNIKK